MYYFDHAATSFPKPPSVAARMTYYLNQVGATINRSTYAPAQEAELVTLQLRQRLSRLLHFPGRPNQVILTSGCTMGLNLVLLGWLRPGDHCIVSALEHNAVIRPLQTLGVSYEILPCDQEGFVSPAQLEARIRPDTRLVVLSHASNVCGAVQDAAAFGRICAAHHIPLLLDAAQSAGHLPLDFQEIQCSAMALPAHKGLLGPTGIGAVLLQEDFARQLRPVFTGGTGSASHQVTQPAFLPDKFEPGTPNLPGIFGWEAALAELERRTVADIRRHDLPLIRRFLDGVHQISGVRLIGPQAAEHRVGVFSLDFPQQDNAVVADRLEQQFGILTRCGLHCAPLAHQALGTFPAGTVRFSLGWSTTRQDVEAALCAIDQLVASAAP